MKFSSLRKRIVERYMRNEDGTVCIEITVNRIEELFNNFDRNAPYVKKELDQDLVDYIISSAYELGNMNFSILFHLNTFTAQDKMIRVSRSIKNYFEYLIALEHKQLADKRKRSLLHLAIGVSLLLLCMNITPSQPEKMGVVLKILSEGLVVAVWVALWSAMEILLISWRPHKRAMKLYRRIADSHIQFRELE